MKRQVEHNHHHNRQRCLRGCVVLICCLLTLVTIVGVVFLVGYKSNNPSPASPSPTRSVVLNAQVNGSLPPFSAPVQVASPPTTPPPASASPPPTGGTPQPVAGVTPPSARTPPPPPPPPLNPPPAVSPPPTVAASPPSQVASPLVYHGGLLLTAPITVHYLFYGEFSGSGNDYVPNTVGNFVSGLSNSNFWNVLSEFKDADGKSVTNTLTNGVIYNTLVNITYGTTVDPVSLLKDYLDQKIFPIDETAVYATIGGSDVNMNNLCTGPCGAHGPIDYNGAKLHIAWVGSLPGCCTITDSSNSPTNSVQSDAIISTLLHELIESATSPNFDGYHTTSGQENGDLCGFSFGTVSTINGKKVNTVLNTPNGLLPYLLSGTFDYTLGTCVWPSQPA